jgi:hypothetical protein
MHLPAEALTGEMPPQWREHRNAAAVFRIFEDLIFRGEWDGPDIDPDSPGLTDEDLAAVVADRLNGYDLAPSGALRVEAEADGPRVTLRVVTLGGWPGEQLDEACYHLDFTRRQQ